MNIVLETDPKVMLEALEKQPWADPLWVGEVSSAPSLMIQPPSPALLNDDLPFHIWEMPQHGESYTVAVDPSVGRINGDPAGIQVVRGWGRQVAEVLLRGFDLPSQIELAVWISRFYNNAMLVIESNGFGLTGAQYATERYKNVWHDDVMHPGFLTTAKRRTMLIGQLQISVKMGLPLRSKRLREELRSFTQGGPAEDDFTSAMLIASGTHGKVRFP